MTEKGRIIELFDDNNVNKIPEPLREEPTKESKKGVTDLTAKEEMEALEENEELIRDWLDDTI